MLTGRGITTYKNKEWLIEQYCTLGYNTYEMAKIAGCTQRTICVWLHRYSIPMKPCNTPISKERSFVTHTNRHKGHEKFTNRKWLYDQYINQQKSSIKIASELECDEQIIVRWLKRHGINIRTASESAIIRSKDVNYIQKRKNYFQSDKFRENQKRRWTPENREAFGLLQSSLWDDERRKDWTVNHSGVNHPMFGKPHLAGKNNPMYGKHPSKYYRRYKVIIDGKEMSFRSTYEVRVAIKLNKLGIEFEYEPEAFDLGNRRYIPDFLIGNVWWEVKGWMDPNSKEKLTKFYSLYPDENLRIVRLEDIKKLEGLIDSSSFDPSQTGNQEVI